jgi:SPP1 gp7 family putative phage head morphogenesis protein
METILTYTTTKLYDPTQTTALRNAFAREMKRRFAELKRVVRTAVVEQDCLGIGQYKMTTMQMIPPGMGAFNFLRDPQKVDAFMRWLQQQENKGILTTGEFKQIGFAVEEAWTNRYILDAYKRGVLRAREELRKAGYDIPIDAMGGISGMPMHLDRVGLLFTRVFSELAGITAQMDTLISQILSQGIMDGDGPALLARKMRAAIDGTGIGTLGITDKLGRFIPAERRAMLLARTEIIRAFHLATIQEYRNWGLEGIYVQAEWWTAGDDRVCTKCAALQGKIFTLDEIEGMIPYHPNCRCIALPYIID